MEVYNTKGVMIMYPLALFAIMLIILPNGYCCGAAAVLVKTNTTFQCDGRLDECIIQDDLELEFLMNPFVSRVLADADPPNSFGEGAVNKPDSAAFPPCDPGYCVPKSGKTNQHGCVKKNSYGCH